MIYNPEYPDRVEYKGNSDARNRILAVVLNIVFSTNLVLLMADKFTALQIICNY